MCTRGGAGGAVAPPRGPIVEKHELKCPLGWQNTLNCPLGWLKHYKLPSWEPKRAEVPSWEPKRTSKKCLKCPSKSLCTPLKFTDIHTVFAEMYMTNIYSVIRLTNVGVFISLYEVRLFFDAFSMNPRNELWKHTERLFNIFHWLIGKKLHPRFINGALPSSPDQPQLWKHVQVVVGPGTQRVVSVGCKNINKYTS